MLENVLLLIRTEVSRSVGREPGATSVMWLVAFAGGVWLGHLVDVAAGVDFASRVSIPRFLLVSFGLLATFYYDADGILEDTKNGRVIDILMTPVSRAQYLASKVASISILATLTYLLAVLGLAVNIAWSQAIPVALKAGAALLVVVPFYWTVATLLCAASLRFPQKLRSVIVFAYIVGITFAVPNLESSGATAKVSSFLFDFLSPLNFVRLSQGIALGSFEPTLMFHGLALPLAVFAGALKLLRKQELQPAKT